MPDQSSPAGRRGALARAVAATVAALLALFVASSPAAVAAAEPSVATDDLGRHYVVTWRAGLDASERVAVLAEVAPAAEVHAVAGGLSVVEATDADAAAIQRAALAGHPAVAHVEAGHVIASTTSDPLYDQQWGLHNVAQDVRGQVGVAGVDVAADEAWARTRGEPDVVVAVVDSGIDVGHEDLAANIWHNRAEADGVAGVDDDGNGFVDDVDGWDFVNDDATVYDGADVDAHGTTVAGIVAAVAGNRVGVAGVAPDVSIMSVKFIEGATGSLTDALLAIDYAAANGADVINASWGQDVGSDALETAIFAAGIPFVAAAGNAGGDLSAGVVRAFPAQYDLPNLRAVAAVDNRGRLTSTSNYGADDVHLGAPGRDVVTTAPDRYAYISGSSAAAPFVSGAVALALSVANVTGSNQILDLLVDTARPLDDLDGRTVSGGMLDAGALVAAVADDGACPEARVRPGEFHDVAAGSVHRAGIACIAWWGISTGTADGRFMPGASVTRGQMASFLARVLEAAGARPTDPPDHFHDDDTSVYEPAINAVAEAGITAGVTADRFGPGQVVSRAAMAALLMSTHAHLTGSATPPGRDWFSDDAGTAHEAAINALAEHGITTGNAAGAFDPDGTVNRAQMATFVARLLDVLTRAGTLTTPPG